MEEEDGNLEPQQSDRAVGKTDPFENRPKSVAQVQLEGLGAQFSYDPSSEGNLYLPNWLQRAYELDSNGRVGELAYALLMERGFNTSPGCKNGSELFREVLRRGTEHLKHPHVPHIEARVRFMMGDVYRDIVVLATGHHGDTYADSATSKPEKAKAILRQLFLGLCPIEPGRPRRVRHCNRPPTMPIAITRTRAMLLAPSWAGWGLGRIAMSLWRVVAPGC